MFFYCEEKVFKYLRPFYRKCYFKFHFFINFSCPLYDHARDHSPPIHFSIDGGSQNLSQVVWFQEIRPSCRNRLELGRLVFSI